MPQHPPLTDGFANCPILVVDDEKLIRLFVEALLKKSGFTVIAFAVNGVDALEMIPKVRPACVILDVNMPVMNGLETLARIRSAENSRDLPVLVVTAHDDRDERNNIMQAGASNLISKPINGDLLVERVTNLVERNLLIEQLSRFHERLTMELSVAATMQTSAVPTADDLVIIEQKYGVRLASLFKPSSELGGDYWSVQSIDPGRFAILTADFTGHGISAALNTFRLDMLLSRLGVCQSSPAEYMETINQELSAVMPVDQFCTMVYVVIDVINDLMIYSAAGAPPPLYGHVGSDEVITGDGSGFPLGIRAQTKYQNREVAFPEGSFLFMYSDALYETECEDIGVLEIEGVAALAAIHQNSDAALALNGVLSEFLEKAPDPLPDDLTAVWLSR